MGLEVPNGGGQRHHRGERDQKVDVVRPAAGAEQGNVLGLGDDGQPFPEIFGMANLISSLLGAEDAMNKIPG